MVKLSTQNAILHKELQDLSMYDERPGYVER